LLFSFELENAMSNRILPTAVLTFLLVGCGDAAFARTAATSQAAQQITADDFVGEWTGALSLPGSQLHLLLHVSKGAEDQLSATLDSVDQQANGIPVSAISAKDGKLSMVVAAVQGTYEGTLNKAKTEIKGTWTQLQPLELTFTRVVKQPSAATGAAAPKENVGVAPSDAEGAWMGTIDAGAMKLRVVFHITNAPDGLKATMDSLDQDAKGIPVTAVTLTGAALKMELKQIDGVYQGKFSRDKATIEGAWTQRGMSRPLVLTRAKDAAALERKRPQNPVPPLPYREEEVSYENKVQGDMLAGTLTIPKGKGPFTAVLLITGSGPQDRDESLMGHKPFLVLSDWLTRKGIEALRVDDRGVGKSTGVFSMGTTADFATDVEAGVAFLKTRPEVNAKKSG
jgi:uncharacterized protein